MSNALSQARDEQQSGQQDWAQGESAPRALYLWEFATNPSHFPGDHAAVVAIDLSASAAVRAAVGSTPFLGVEEAAAAVLGSRAMAELMIEKIEEIAQETGAAADVLNVAKQSVAVENIRKSWREAEPVENKPVAPGETVFFISFASAMETRAIKGTNADENRRAVESFTRRLADEMKDAAEKALGAGCVVMAKNAPSAESLIPALVALEQARALRKAVAEGSENRSTEAPGPERKPRAL
jgi:hypothetical protein